MVVALTVSSVAALTAISILAKENKNSCFGAALENRCRGPYVTRGAQRVPTAMYLAVGQMAGSTSYLSFEPLTCIALRIRACIVCYNSIEHRHQLGSQSKQLVT